VGQRRLTESIDTSTPGGELVCSAPEAAYRVDPGEAQRRSGDSRDRAPAPCDRARVDDARKL